MAGTYKHSSAVKEKKTTKDDASPEQHPDFSGIILILGFHPCSFCFKGQWAWADRDFTPVDGLRKRPWHRGTEHQQKRRPTRDQPTPVHPRQTTKEPWIRSVYGFSLWNHWLPALVVTGSPGY